MFKPAIAALVTAIVIVGGASAYSAAVTPGQFSALKAQVAALKTQVAKLTVQTNGDANTVQSRLTSDEASVQADQTHVTCLLDRWNHTGYITQDEIVWNTVAHLSGLTDPALVIPVITQSKMVTCP